MLRRWLLYLAGLAGCLIFHYFYRQWFSFLLLAVVVLLPLLSLAVSLPAMLLTRFRLLCPGSCTQGKKLVPQLAVSCWLPVPEYRLKLQVTDPAGSQVLLHLGEPLPAEHCANLRCRIHRLRIYDYLGLFFLPRYLTDSADVTVCPRPMAVRQLPELDRYLSQMWKPKAGGGFSENHELRLYRPGDSLHHIHWKLTAKTGKTIVREAMEPIRRRVIIGIELEPTSTELDRKLGRLWWLAEHLLEQGLPCRIRALTGEGIRELPVTSPEDLRHAIATLLQCPRVAPSEKMDSFSAAWHYIVGGGPDEA